MFSLIKGVLRRRKREQLRGAAFPSGWNEILRRKVPLFNRLDSNDKEELRWRMHVFLTEKQFEGCGGLTITDEMMVSIAGHASFLLLHRDTDFYPALYSILVYPCHGSDHAYQCSTLKSCVQDRKEYEETREEQKKNLS